MSFREPPRVLNLSFREPCIDIIIPSEEDHIEMFPFDFEEFLWALGDDATVPLIRQCFDAKAPLGQALHRKIMNDFRQYILVGGMPQAVHEYVKTKDFEAVDIVKRRKRKSISYPRFQSTLVSEVMKKASSG